MKIKQILVALFRRRPNAPWFGYVLPALVSAFFGLWGAADEGWQAGVLYAIILAICIIQIFYRSVIGWILVLLPCVIYAVEVAMNPQNGPLHEYILFLMFGLVPSASLAIAHPFRKPASSIVTDDNGS